MLDKRAPFRSYEKRFGSPRDAVKLRVKCLVCQRQRARRPMFTKDGAITVGEGVMVSSPHSRRNRLCGAVVCTRESHLNEGLHLHFHLRLFSHDSSRGY